MQFGREGTLVARLASAILLVGLGACKPPPEQRQFMPQADPGRGLQAIDRAGCGACHSIPGIDWPRGRVGPDLSGFGDRTLIAGSVPNRPDLLAAYVRDAPSVDPGSGMPSMPLSEEESRDVAAYLYTLVAR